MLSEPKAGGHDFNSQEAPISVDEDCRRDKYLSMNHAKNVCKISLPRITVNWDAFLDVFGQESADEPDSKSVD